MFLANIYWTAALVVIIRLSQMVNAVFISLKQRISFTYKQ